MGAHAVTPDHTYESYTEEILSDQLPAILDSKLADSADVFCEPDGFRSNSPKTYSAHAEAVSICVCTSMNSLMEVVENLLLN